jgi:hypothetical protein
VRAQSEEAKRPSCPANIDLKHMVVKGTLQGSNLRSHEIRIVSENGQGLVERVRYQPFHVIAGSHTCESQLLEHDANSNSVKTTGAARRTPLAATYRRGPAGRSRASGASRAPAAASRR